MGASEETLALLKRIAVAVEKSAAILERMEKRSAAKAPKEVASDRDLDHPQYGDPEIKKDPKRWEGPQVAPCRMSECPPEYLDCLADLLDWQADKAEEKNETTESGKPIAAYRRRDAAKARGWAKRLRSGWKPPAPQHEQEQLDNDNTPDPFASDTGGGGW